MQEVNDDRVDQPFAYNQNQQHIPSYHYLSHDQDDMTRKVAGFDVKVKSIIW